MNRKLNDLELKKVKGGSISLLGAICIGVGAVFFAGVIDGIARPLSCNN